MAVQSSILPPSGCDVSSHKLELMMLQAGFWLINTYKLLYSLGNVEIHGLQAHEESWIAIVVLQDTLKYMNALLYRYLSKLTGNLCLARDAYQYLSLSLLNCLRWQVSHYLLSTEYTPKNLLDCVLITFFSALQLCYSASFKVFLKKTKKRKKSFQPFIVILSKFRALSFL